MQQQADLSQLVTLLSTISGPLMSALGGITFTVGGRDVRMTVNPSKEDKTPAELDTPEVEEAEEEEEEEADSVDPIVDEAKIALIHHLNGVRLAAKIIADKMDAGYYESGDLYWDDYHSISWNSWQAACLVSGCTDPYLVHEGEKRAGIARDDICVTRLTPQGKKDVLEALRKPKEKEQV